MKTCARYGCSNPVFAKLYCRAHQWCRTDESYKKQKAFRKSKPKAESVKRQKDHKSYSQNCKDLEKEMREQNKGKIYCFFSRLEIKGTAIWHHLHKREGDYYLDKEWLVPCINEYHLDYHLKSIGWLLQQPWYSGFLARLKEKSEDLFQKEQKKRDKCLEIEFD